jgi:hypothetical protein
MLTMTAAAISIGAIVAPVSTAHAQVQFTGDEFQINTSNPEYGPVVVGLAGGGFIAVWSNSADDVVARTFDASGTPTGGELAVSTPSAILQQWPSIASAPNGEMVVTWQIYSGGIYLGVMGRRINAAGTPIGTEFQISTGRSNSGAAWTSNTEFLAGWREQDADDWGVFARRFDSDGVPQGTAFQVNTYTTGFQGLSDIEALSDGSVVVVWFGEGQDGLPYGVHAQRLDASGAPLGGEFQVNTGPGFYSTVARVASFASGEFMVVVSASDVLAHRYSNGGTALGTPFQVNSEAYATGAADAAELSDGSFVVTWKGLMSGTTTPVARLFDANAVPFGPDFRVSTHTATDQYGGTVAATNDGGFVIAWPGQGNLIGRSFCVGTAGPDADLDGVPDKCDRCPGADDADDADADDVPDQCDPCTNVGGEREITIKPYLVLSSFSQSDDLALLRGGFTVGTSFAALDPVANGARIIIRAAGGSTLLDFDAAPGAFDGTKGWTVNAAGTRFKYKDKSPEGVRKLSISDKGNVSPGRVDFKGKIVVMNFPWIPSTSHRNATIIVGDPTLGECGETAFVASECESTLYGYFHSATTCRR